MVAEPFSQGTSSETDTEQVAESKQQFLRFHLVPDTTAILPLHQITEVLTMAVGEIMPIPHMPVWVMGVYNWRGEILWMVDLGYLVGLTPWYQQVTNDSTYTTIVIQSMQQVRSPQQVGNSGTGKKQLGLVVNRVEDMEQCHPEEIQSLPATTPELVPFLRGSWQNANGEVLLVMDSDAIIARMPQ